MEEAMSYAVSRLYEPVGEIEANIMQWAGLKESMTVFDLGCGSGRLAHAISKRFAKLEFTGANVVQSLLDYAATKTPKNYRFVLNRAYRYRCPTSLWMCAHLQRLHTSAALRNLSLPRGHVPGAEAGGRVVLSFLEFINLNHWAAFEGECNARPTQTASHLNSLIERPVIDIWATRIGFEKAVLVSADAAPWDTNALGQSVATLRKPTSRK